MRRAEIRDAVAYTAKLALARTLVATGAMSRRRRAVLAGRAVVLAYHRVLADGTETASHPGIIVSPETFDRHMAVLRREFHPLTLPAFEAHLASGDAFPPGACLVTFDDGWIDTATTAAPILERHGIPAVVFLPTAFIGGEAVFWQETLGHRLSAAIAAATPGLTRTVGEVLTASGLEVLVPALGRGSRDDVFEAIRRVKQDVAADPEAALRALDGLLGAGAGRLPVDRFMDWDEVRGLRARGVTFAAHGHSHRILSRLPAADIGADLQSARDVLVRELGEAPGSVSYPNGGWNGEVTAAAARLGFVAGFTMDRGHVEAGGPPFAVRRMNIHDGLTRDAAMFRGRLLGVL